MSASFPKVKGFKKDRRNLIESTNNLVVFGRGQMPPEIGVNKGRRLLRRGGLRQRRSKPKPLLPPGACSTTQKLDQLVHRVELSNYFSNTKPWNDPAQKNPSFITQPYYLPNSSVESEIAVIIQPTTEDFGDVATTLLVGEDEVPLPKQQQTLVYPDKSPSLNFVKDVVCPVCLKGFEPLAYSKVPVSELMKHSLAAYQQQNGMVFKKNLEDGWGALAKPKCVLEPQDVVVAANCGELFHRLCLRDWCARGHRKSPRSMKPIASCPSCGKELKYTLCQEVETLRCFSRDSTMLQREFIKVRHVNKELQQLWPETNNYLRRIKKEIEDTETLYNELRSKRRGVKSELKKLTAEDFGIVMAKVSDVTTLKATLKKQEKAMEFMQQETLHIVRMYLLTIIRKLKACGIPIPIPGELVSDQELQNLIGPISPRLVPYLQDIVNDNHALSLFSRILVPLPDADDNLDGTRQKSLELEIVELFVNDPKSPPTLTRPNTYVVSSSAAEVGDSDTDDVMTKRIESSSSVEDKDTVTAGTSLKTSSATHEISTIPSSYPPQNPLCVQNTNNLIVACPDKPLQLLEISGVDESFSTMDSDSLEGRFLEINCKTSAGTCVDKVQITNRTTSCYSSASSVRSSFEKGIGDSQSAVILAQNSFDKTKADPTTTLQCYEQDSKYVKAIRQLMTQSFGEPFPTKITTPEVISAMEKNSGAGKRVKNFHLEPRNNETADESKMKTVVLLPISEDKKSSQSIDCRNSTKNEALRDKTLIKVKDDDWVPISPAVTPVREKNCQPDKTSRQTIESNNYPSFYENTVYSNQSCEPIFTEGFQMRSLPGTSRCRNNGDTRSTKGIPSQKEPDKVSIAIMYIIENESRGDTETEPEDDKNATERKKGNEETVPKELLLPFLPTKVLSPVFITAEKTSTYSMIANRNSFTGKDSSSSSELFDPFAWSQRNVVKCNDCENDCTNNKSDIVESSPNNNSMLEPIILPPEGPARPEEIAQASTVPPTLTYENETEMR